MDYVVFTDESYITANRFRSIAAYSVPYPVFKRVEGDMVCLLQESNVNEFKWDKLRNAKYRFCAVKIINNVLEAIKKNDARIDVLVWDTQDSRHTIQGRNDDANFERMFFHLLSSSMKRRCKGSRWGIYPDERSGINWETVNTCLSAVGKRSGNSMPLFAKSFFSESFFHVTEMTQVSSCIQPLSQVADLFAGLSVFSRESYQKYSLWLRKESQMIDLFEEIETDTDTLSNKERERFKVLQHFDDQCKNRKLGVSLESRKYLHTPDPSNPINFWTYQPQHKLDKAPTRKTKVN